MCSCVYIRIGLICCYIYYNIFSAQLAVLNCGDQGNRICYKLDYRCISGNCVCVGDLCSELSKDDGVVYQSSLIPSMSPTITPTKTPSISPTISPSDIPSLFPTNHPSNTPSLAPTQTPTLTPTQRTEVPTKGPSISPTNGPSNIPTSTPTQIPSLLPSQSPSVSAIKTTIGEPFTLIPTISPSNIITTNFLSSELPTQTPSETSETIELPDAIETSNTVTSIGLPFNLTLLLYIMAGGSLIILSCILLIIFLHCYWSHKAKMNQKHNKISINIDIPGTTSGSAIPVPTLSPNTDDGIDRLETIGGNDSPEPETNEITKFTPGYDNESESESSQSILNNNNITPNIFENTKMGDNNKHELNMFSNNNNVTRINIPFDNMEGYTKSSQKYVE